MRINQFKMGHVVLVQGIDEQDYFQMKAKYPSDEALEHYKHVFNGWIDCKSPMDKWESFEDAPSKSTIHRRVKNWMARDGKHGVTLILQYRSAGWDHKKPDNDNQLVVVLRHSGSDSSETLKVLNANCRQRPNPSLNADATHRLAPR